MMRVLAAILMAFMLLSGSLGSLQPVPAARAAFGPVPVLAYYYIWFEPSSWDRAKTDYPVLGRYSSDDAAIMEKHVVAAKAAGIDGFIVSWKSTPKLDARLTQLAAIANEHEFKLVVIYQSLDFARLPQPVEQIRSDLVVFAETWGDDPAFALWEKPAVILSGTWEFTPKEIAEIIGDSRERLLVLASERSVEGYERLAKLVDGDAYYWSSADPETSGFAPRLAALGAAVHEHGGRWIAPAAPGFDARLVGGARVIDRQGGETLRAQITGALDSAPDALGIISWNEFSENTHVEPSEQYGTTALRVIADIADTELGSALDGMAFDSDASALDVVDGTGPERLLAMGALLIAVVLAWIVLLRRSRVRPEDEAAELPIG